MKGLLCICKITPEKHPPNNPRPGCSKLTTSLVNETLKFQTLISQICQYFFVEKRVISFCSAKAFLIFSTKNISVHVFGYKVLKCLTS